MIPLLEKLKEEVTLLSALFADPQPGLHTWNVAVGRRWERISKLYTEGMDEKGNIIGVIKI